MNIRPSLLFTLFVLFTLSFAGTAGAARLTGGVRAVVLTDEMRHYGDEYWLYMSGGNTLGAPVFIGFEPFSPPTVRQTGPDELIVNDSYLKIDLRPSLRSGVITVLNVRPLHFLGVDQGDVIRFQSFSTKALWYNQGTGPSNIGTIQGWNGYEEQGIFNLTRGSNIYTGTGDYEHLWGNSIVKTLYQGSDLLYEQWGVFVTNAYSGFMWEYRNTGGLVWQDGGLLFLDNGTYEALGSTFIGDTYQTTDGQGCTTFSVNAGTSRGALQVSLSGFHSLEGTGCRRQFVAFTMSGTLGSQAISGWGLFETQRVSSSTTTTTSSTTTSSTTASTTTTSFTTTTSTTTTTSISTVKLGTSLTLTISPNPLPLGQIGTASGRLTDSNGAGVAGRSVTIQTSTDQVTWTKAVKLMTASDGSFSVSGQSRTTGTFYERVVFSGDGSYLASTSSAVQYTVS